MLEGVGSLKVRVWLVRVGGGLISPSERRSMSLLEIGWTCTTDVAHAQTALLWAQAPARRHVIFWHGSKTSMTIFLKKPARSRSVLSGLSSLMPGTRERLDRLAEGGPAALASW